MTTQRFRAHLVTAAGETYPTKVEFSRRGVNDQYLTETINPEVARRYRRLAFTCQHYPASSAILQKIAALANRSEIQVRDAFDLYVLWLGGHLHAGAIGSLPKAVRIRAQNNVLEFTYADYQGQVLDYLEPAQLDHFDNEDCWNDICERLLTVLEAPGQ